MITNPIIPFYKQLDKMVVRSRDCYLYDAGNNEYIDFESGDWAAILGHAHERINRVIKNQVDLGIHDGLRFRNKPSEELSTQLLKKLSLHEGQSVFLNSGSEAVNLGITLAMHVTKRSKVLKLDCSYLSAFGYGKNTPGNTALVNIPMDNIHAIKQVDFNEIAAFVFEPGNSTGLIKFPSNELIMAIATAVRHHGGLLMANEVTTGFGRTGKWFGFQHYDYKPELISMGKALGNGYPVSCLSVSHEVSALFNMAPFRYAQSHQNDPLGCAIGLEVIRVLEDDDLVRQSHEKGQYFRDQLHALQTQYPEQITEIRARGLMLALEFSSLVNGEEIYLQLIENGFLTGFRENNLRFMPPLTIEKADIDKLIATIDKLIRVLSV